MITHDKLIKLLKKSGADIDFDNLDPNKNLPDIGLDSLDTYNFFVEIDDDLGVEVPDEVFEELNTLEKIRNYLESKLNG
jgi:acyl carrier protein